MYDDIERPPRVNLFAVNVLAVSPLVESLVQENLRDIIDADDIQRLQQLLSEDDAERLLSATYGGNPDGSTDVRGLLQETPPLLHAALRGRKNTVSVLLYALLVILPARAYIV